MKDFADDNFKFDNNERKFFKWVENTMGKEEIARYWHFSFSHNVFKRVALQTHENKGLFGEGLTSIG